ncbi:DNA polymerase III subunit delta [Psychromonas sp. CNPT3]|uniref:DNA polymerase III subunit delta n=1 Tax=Psychromonas sp. CNPT3 TaxID=314282 RepID=UPI00006E4426|nr:DNA polymerase III subunit delta [Psychromonas sp. CNPT3]AGH80688.1 DNA polymerase III subunit delta [Psychromonas sp. CNPT3]
MRIYPEQLAQHLKQKIPACILIFGDEILFSLEALQQIKTSAKQQGYLEIFQFDMGVNFASDDIFNHFVSRSLFSEKKIILLTLPKTSKENTAFIREVTPLLNEDILLIIQGPKLNTQQMNSVWFKQLEKIGLFVATLAPNQQRFPQWIFQRLKSLQLEASNEVIEYLCVHFEGNLLGAKQEFEKLALIYPKQKLTLQQVEKNITTHCHFSIFQWVDSLLVGAQGRSLRILKQLQNEDTEILLLSATLSSEIQKLLKISYQKNTVALEQLLEQQQPKLWTAKKQILKKALTRLDTQRLEQLVQMSAQLEIAIKVENSPQSWLLLERICYAFI